MFGLLVLCRPTFWPLAGLMVVAWSVKCWRDSCAVAKADNISPGAGITVVADAASVGADLLSMTDMPTLAASATGKLNVLPLKSCRLGTT